MSPVGPGLQDKYRGEYQNGFANGLGLMNYANGDIAFGYWKNGMLHSDGNEDRPCVYQRATKDNASFFGIFNFDHAVEGRLFRNDRDNGKFEKLFDILQIPDTVQTASFWDKFFWDEILPLPAKVNPQPGEFKRDEWKNMTVNDLLKQLPAVIKK